MEGATCGTHKLRTLSGHALVRGSVFATSGIWTHMSSTSSVRTTSSSIIPTHLHPHPHPSPAPAPHAHTPSSPSYLSPPRGCSLASQHTARFRCKALERHLAPQGRTTATEVEAHEAQNTSRRQKQPPPGERPGSLSDSSALAFLLRHSVDRQKERERRRRRRGSFPHSLQPTVPPDRL